MRPTLFRLCDQPHFDYATNLISTMRPTLFRLCDPTNVLVCIVGMGPGHGPGHGPGPHAFVRCVVFRLRRSATFSESCFFPLCSLPASPERDIFRILPFSAVYSSGFAGARHFWNSTFSKSEHLQSALLGHSTHSCKSLQITHPQPK